jgi:hypothetical protein
MTATDGCLFRARDFKGQAELSARPSTVRLSAIANSEHHAGFDAPMENPR